MRHHRTIAGWRPVCMCVCVGGVIEIGRIWVSVFCLSCIKKKNGRTCCWVNTRSLRPCAVSTSSEEFKPGTINQLLKSKKDNKTRCVTEWVPSYLCRLEDPPQLVSSWCLLAVLSPILSHGFVEKQPIRGRGAESGLWGGVRWMGEGEKAPLIRQNGKKTVRKSEELWISKKKTKKKQLYQRQLWATTKAHWNNSNKTQHFTSSCASDTFNVAEILGVFQDLIHQPMLPFLSKNRK